MIPTQLSHLEKRAPRRLRRPPLRPGFWWHIRGVEVGAVRMEWTEHDGASFIARGVIGITADQVYRLAQDMFAPINNPALSIR